MSGQQKGHCEQAKGNGCIRAERRAGQAGQGCAAARGFPRAAGSLRVQGREGRHLGWLHPRRWLWEACVVASAAPAQAWASPLPVCPQLSQHHPEPALPHPRQPVLRGPGGPGPAARQLPLPARHSEYSPLSRGAPPPPLAGIPQLRIQTYPPRKPVGPPQRQRG